MDSLGSRTGSKGKFGEGPQVDEDPSRRLPVSATT